MIATWLAKKLGKQWQFVEGYDLSLNETTTDNLLDVADREGVTKAVSHMFDTWRQQYSTEVSVATLVGAISELMN